MKSIYNRLKKTFCLCLICVVCGLIYPTNAPASSEFLQNFNIDECDPFEVRALITTVHGIKAQFVAAEQTIYVVNLSLGDQQLITELTDAHGNSMDFGSLRQGEWVYVKGFKHIDGDVVALLVQKIDAPERKKPVLRKIIKKPRRHN